MVQRERSDLEYDLSSDGGDQSRNTPSNGFRDRSRDIDRSQQNAEDMARYLLERATLYWNLFITVTNNLMDRYHVKEIATAIYDGLKKYPLLVLSITAVFFILSLPFMIFVFFTLATTIMTLTGFVLIEGTLITVASMLLIGVLIGVGCLLGTIGLVFLVGYFVFPRRTTGWTGGANKELGVLVRDMLGRKSKLKSVKCLSCSNVVSQVTGSLLGSCAQY
ncbi:uncharacterized protein LOC5571914 [Aedes aegypti]|uniref:Uncharacterized protein n=1 Tax=Aedes aegypti TaxID=7159 RepID=A0A1S4FM78_AEDAE|nr:uncharacterized protein LOC5571914 [Aedes aegypti]